MFSPLSPDSPKLLKGFITIKKTFEINLKQFYPVGDDRNNANWQVISHTKNISTKVSSEWQKIGINSFSVK